MRNLDITAFHYNKPPLTFWKSLIWRNFLVRIYKGPIKNPSLTFWKKRRQGGVFYNERLWYIDVSYLKTFLEPPKNKKFTFLMIFAISDGQLSYTQWVWISKNHHLLAFMTIEFDIGVVRPPCLLWEIDMIIKKLTNTNFMSWETTEKILERPEVAVVSHQNSLFEVVA